MASDAKAEGLYRTELQHSDWEKERNLPVGDTALLDELRDSFQIQNHNLIYSTAVADDKRTCRFPAIEFA
jgi:hypothetical protein